MLRRSSLIFLTALTLALSVRATSLAAPELQYQLSNSLDGWSTFSHTVKPNGFAVHLDANEQYQGKPAAVFTSTNRKQDSDYYVVVYQEFKADAYRGKRIKFSAVTKGECTQGNVHIFAKTNNQNRVLSFDNRGDRPIQSSAQWQPVSVVLDVAPESDKITIGFDFRGAGKIWLSGLTLTQAGADDATTAADKIDLDEYKFYKTELPSKPLELNFEDIAKERGPRQLLHWGTRGDRDQADKEYETYCDRQVKLKGKDSASIASLVADPKSFVLIDQDFGADDYVGKRVKFSSNIKTQDVKDWAAIFMRVDGVKDVLAFDNMEDRPMKGTSDWRPAAVVLDVPPSARKIRIGFMQAGAGHSWFSNNSIESVDKTTATTGEVLKPDKVKMETLRDRPDLDLREK